MRESRILHQTLLVLLLAVCPARMIAEDPLVGARIVIDEAVCDMGEISKSQDPKREHIFVFRNVGDAPLIINHIATGCGCTTPTYSKKSVKPGKRGKIKVVFDASTQHPGKFSKSCTIFTNDSRRYTRVHVYGTIVE